MKEMRGVAPIMIGLVIILAIVVAAGVWYATRPSAKKVEINFLISPVPSIEKLVDTIPEFEAETGIDVTVTKVSYDDMCEKAALDVKSKTGTYTVFWVEPAHLGRLVGLEGLEPLEPLAERLDVDLTDFPQSYLNNFSYEGVLYAFPFESCLMVMAYRTDLFDELDLSVPTTWEDYKEAAIALDESGKVSSGTSIMGARHEALFCEYCNFLWGFGGSLFDETGYPSINTPEAVEALEFLKSLLPYAPAGTLTYTWTESGTAFIVGDIGTEIIFSDWTADMVNPETSGVIGKWAYAPIPGTGPTFFGGYGWAINAYASDEEKEAAFRFANWATSAEMQRRLIELGLTPTRISVMEDPELIAEYFYLSAYAETMDRAQPVMKIPVYFELMDSITMHLNAALSGIEDIQSALNSAQSEWEEIMSTADLI